MPNSSHVHLPVPKLYSEYLKLPAKERETAELQVQHNLGLELNLRDQKRVEAQSRGPSNPTERLRELYFSLQSEEVDLNGGLAAALYGVIQTNIRRELNGKFKRDFSDQHLQYLALLAEAACQDPRLCGPFIEILEQVKSPGPLLAGALLFGVWAMQKSFEAGNWQAGRDETRQSAWDLFSQSAAHYLSDERGYSMNELARSFPVLAIGFGRLFESADRKRIMLDRSYPAFRLFGAYLTAVVEQAPQLADGFHGNVKSMISDPLLLTLISLAELKNFEKILESAHLQQFSLLKNKDDNFRLSQRISDSFARLDQVHERDLPFLARAYRQHLGSLPNFSTVFSDLFSNRQFASLCPQDWVDPGRLWLSQYKARYASIIDAMR